MPDESPLAPYQNGFDDGYAEGLHRGRREGKHTERTSAGWGEFYRLDLGGGNVVEIRASFNIFTMSDRAVELIRAVHPFVREFADREEPADV